jgi:hypothetical protein
MNRGAWPLSKSSEFFYCGKKPFNALIAPLKSSEPTSFWDEAEGSVSMGNHYKTTAPVALSKSGSQYRPAS